MKEQEGGNIWTAHHNGFWIAIGTNGFIKKDGTNVMGAGVALQAKDRFPGISKRVGEAIKVYGNHVYPITELHIVTFPTKHNWFQKADLTLIARSAVELNAIPAEMFGNRTVYIPRVGCGNGGLDWAHVQPILSKLLDDRFTVVHFGPEKK